MDVDFAEGLDGVRDPSQERWYIALALSSGVSLAEVLMTHDVRPFTGPVCSMRIDSCRDDDWVVADRRGPRRRSRTAVGLGDDLEFA